MDHLTLEIPNPDMLKIPSGVVKADLSLAEVGLLVAFVAVTEQHTDFENPIFRDPTAQAATKLLRDKGILEVNTETVNGNTKVKLNVNLDKLPLRPQL